MCKMYKDMKKNYNIPLTETVMLNASCAILSVSGKALEQSLSKPNVGSTANSENAF